MRAGYRVNFMITDGIFHINCDGWPPDAGGETVYLSKNEDEVLLSIQPISNCLSLVYRDKVCYLDYHTQNNNITNEK